MPSLRPTSLTARLVVTAVALLALVSVLIATATTLALRHELLNQVDADLGKTSGPPALAPASEPDDEGGESEPRFKNFDDDDHGWPGLLFRIDRGAVIQVQGAPLSGDDIGDRLSGVPVDGAGHTVRLAGRDYRVLAVKDEVGVVLAALPMERVNGPLESLLLKELLFILVGVGSAGAAALVLVRRQLRPLRQVAATAHEVAALPLAEGEIGLTARVPEELTDERTEVGQVGAALNTLLGHVEGALDARHRSEQQVRRFVADASHELRTPLATIQGYAELSRRTGSEPARMSDALAKVETEATRMSSLVEDLLLLARLDAGRPLAREEVDLTRLVLESAADARVVAPDHNWQLDLAEEPVKVIGDEQRLHQVVANLLSNARRHTPAGTTVTVTVREGRDRALVRVHDDGSGLPKALNGKVFERFSRGDTARTRGAGGSGLGLSIAQAISAAHGGALTVESKPGSTTFTLTLPVHSSAVAAHEADATAAEAVERGPVSRA